MFKLDTTKTNIKVMGGVNTPTIYLSKIAQDKMKEYIGQCKEEIGWLGSVEKIGKDYYVSDMYLLNQEVHGTTTELTTTGLTAFAEELMSIPNGMDIWNSIKFWGHSHVNMSVSPSGQDESQMKVFADSGHDFIIRCIGNKRDEIRFDLFDYESGLVYEHLPHHMIMSEEQVSYDKQLKEFEEQIKAQRKVFEESISNASEELKQTIKAEIAEKVKPLVTRYTYVKPATNIINMYENDDIPYLGYQSYESYVSLKDDKKKTEEEKQLEKQEKMVEVGQIYGLTVEEIAEAFLYKTPYEVMQYMISLGYNVNYADAKEILDVAETAYGIIYFGEEVLV